MYLSNYHSHTIYCDGRSVAEEYVLEAIRLGFKAFGFSAHSPLPFSTVWNMPAEKMDDYITEIRGLQRKYKEQIEVYLGLEVDYLTPDYNASIPYFKDLDLDFRIGSVHFVYGPENNRMMSIDGPSSEFDEGVKEAFGGDLNATIREFFRSSMDMVERGGFEIVGHVDKIQMNGRLHPGFDYTSTLYNQLIDDLFALIAEKELIVEINTKSLGPKGILYPHADLFKRLKGFNIPIQVNSDSHHPSLITDGFDHVYSLLKEHGFKATRELIGGKWCDVAI
ncbi:histidinol-phosphatase [Porphyromonadaceae bacterium]